MYLVGDLWLVVEGCMNKMDEKENGLGQNKWRSENDLMISFSFLFFLFSHIRFISLEFTSS